MSFGDQMKQKADEVHLQDKAKDLGDAVAEVVKAAVGMASTFAAENRPKVDGMLDKAEAKIGEKAGPKHAETITKARSKVDQGLDKVSEKAAETDGPTATGATDVPKTNPWATPADSTVPPDTTSAFDEQGPAGSPS
ncbi:MAG: antitoxin [Terracoccus sp.]